MAGASKVHLGRSQQSAVLWCASEPRSEPERSGTANIGAPVSHNCTTVQFSTFVYSPLPHLSSRSIISIIVRPFDLWHKTTANESKTFLLSQPPISQPSRRRVSPLPTFGPRRSVLAARAPHYAALKYPAVSMHVLSFQSLFKRLRRLVGTTSCT